MLRQLRVGNNNEETEFERRLVQQRYWVIGQSNALGNNKAKFGRCTKLAMRPIHPDMVNLPIGRVGDNVYCFKNTGVDFVGSFEVTVCLKPVNKPLLFV